MTGAPRHGSDHDGPIPVVREDDIRPVRHGSRASARAGRAGAVAVVALLLVSLVRPWDLGSRDGAQPPPGPRTGGASGTPLAPVATPEPTPWMADAAGSPACASPRSWRIATIESWFGRTARVWAAAEAVDGSPRDPTLEFAPVIAEQITALGWCAPVDGDDRPPLTARGRLWRIDGDALTTVVPVRLEPGGPHALGELWGTPDGGEWPVGRYVIELMTPSATWRRVLALDLRTARAEPEPTGPSGSTAPSESPGETEPTPLVTETGAPRP